MGTAVAAKLLDRGVWTAGYLVDGAPVLLAIDTLGNCIRRVRVAPNMDEGCARAWLEGLLEHYDPPPVKPKLRLLAVAQHARVPASVFVLLNRPHARRR